MTSIAIIRLRRRFRTQPVQAVVENIRQVCYWSRIAHAPKQIIVFRKYIQFRSIAANLADSRETRANRAMTNRIGYRK